MDQWVLTQLGAGGGGDVIGCAIQIVIGTWSDPVDGRLVAYSWKKGISAVGANKRSRTEGQEARFRGKRVCTPGVFRRVYL